MPRIAMYICSILLFIVVIDAQSQQVDQIESGQLVYQRVIDGDTIIVYRDNGIRNYTISTTECGSISQDGKTIALRSRLKSG